MDKTFDYFAAYERQARYAEEMVLNLESAIEGGELGTRELQKALHVIEGDADEVNHVIQSHLMGDFFVPLDRGPMVALAHALDDVCDGLEQISIDAYTRKFEVEAGNVPHDMADFVVYLKNGVMSLGAAVSLLRAYRKKRDEIKRHCVEAQNCEALADELYIDSVRKLYEDESGGDRACRVRHELLDTMEDAMDCIETAAEHLEAIVVESL